LRRAIINSAIDPQTAFAIMASASQPGQLLRPFQIVCFRCQRRNAPFVQNPWRRKAFSTSRPHNDELEQAASQQDPPPINPAPPLNLGIDDEVEATLEKSTSNRPARIVPVSPSYFTAAPQFNDSLLLLRSLLREFSTLPSLPPGEAAPPASWVKLTQYKSQIKEFISPRKFSELLLLLKRLNRIQPNLQPQRVLNALDLFRRPGAVVAQKPRPKTLDEDGRSHALGRRKESSAKVYLVEGSGEVLVNSKSIIDAFPRLHDRESALWPLKVTARMNKYNVFALARGGGVTGQAESITLALARALLVHEPALKPTLRRGQFESLTDSSSTDPNHLIFFDRANL
jgi:ribosomal protein S9